MQREKGREGVECGGVSGCFCRDRNMPHCGAVWCNEYVAVRVYQEVLGTKREQRKTKAVQPAVRPVGQPLSTTTA